MTLMCSVEGHCAMWAERYLSYCLCSTRDGVSLTLGAISVVSWTVAEIPQIITSYKTKSADGLSIAFLATWIIGDIFNLVGCMLEPATLPTQYYTALLYTLTTAIMSSQSIYYNYIYPKLRLWKIQKASKHEQTEAAKRVKEISSDVGVTRSRNIDFHNGTVFGAPIPFPKGNQNASPGREIYYRSARSLTSGHTPTTVSFLAQKMNASTVSNDTQSIEEPLLRGHNDTQSTTPPTTKAMFCLVSMITFISTFNLHRSSNRELSTVFGKRNRGFVTRVTRKLLQVSGGVNVAEQSSGIATFLGWAMAAIYMGGRLPQIWLNIRRGNVEGLNPFMFVLALIGNITYVASILIKSMEWSKIFPNLPWLVDAGGCVLLDIFILIQFAYFRNRTSQDSEDKQDKLEVA